MAGPQACLASATSSVQGWPSSVHGPWGLYTVSLRESRGRRGGVWAQEGLCVAYHTTTLHGATGFTPPGVGPGGLRLQGPAADAPQSGRPLCPRPRVPGGGEVSPRSQPGPRDAGGARRC